MRRREFIAGLAPIIACPLVAVAQPATKLHRVGFLWDSPAVFPEAMAAFRQEIGKLGYIEGQTASQNVCAKWRKSWSSLRSTQLSRRARYIRELQRRRRRKSRSYFSV